MANQRAKPDVNRAKALIAVTNDAYEETRELLVDPATNRLLVSAVISNAPENPTTTATRSTVAASASTVTILASNSSRVGATITNDSTAVLYLTLGASGTTTDFTVKMYSYEYFEMPYDYTGIVTGVWSSATGNARVTELTP